MRLISRQRGVSLIEVLVAIVVFSIGVLGLALLQMKGAQFTKESGSRGYAVLQARSLVDAMRANPAAAVMPRGAANPAAPTATECPYCFNGSTPPQLAGCGTSCTSQQVAQNDVSTWVSRLASVAPGPIGGSLATVTWDAANGRYNIVVSWSGGNNGSATADASTNLSYTLTYLP